VKVRIDQELCTGDGLCENIAPDVFTVLGDGLGYIIDGGDVVRAACVVPSKFEQAVVEAAEQCPGECIFIDRT
jgi:ferredoxin